MKLKNYLVLLIGIGYGTCVADSIVTNARSIAAFGTDRAYMIDAGLYLNRWDPVLLKWVPIAFPTPTIRQMDCTTSGTYLIGTDISSIVRKWSETMGYLSPWSYPRGSEHFDWVKLDSLTYETKGLISGQDGAWKTWDPKSPLAGDPWYQYSPVGPLGEDKADTVLLVDRNSTRYKAWERGDDGYFVALNKSGMSGMPFKIYYYGDDEGYALSRITNPPIGSTNIDTVLVKQISYDEVRKNLWCIDIFGSPWQWDNVAQQWILRNVKSDSTIVTTPYTDLIKLLRTENQFYVRTSYIPGLLKPMLIVLRDTRIMHLILGDLSVEQMTSLDVIILSKRRNSPFHEILLQPRQTPQKIVRLDNTKRIRENGYLERLLMENGIIASPDAIGVYPATLSVIRR
jgi:hypothetical protein